MSYFGKFPSIDLDLKVTTIRSTGKVLKAKWSPEASQDLYNRNRRPGSIEESNRLFQISFKFNELFPPGSIVHINESKLLGWAQADITKPEIRAVQVTSEAVVLIDKCSVGFLCSESQDDGDFYFVDDLMEYEWGQLEP